MSENKVSFNVVPVLIVLIFILTILPFDVRSPKKNIFEFDKAANEGYIAFIVNEYKPGDNIPDDEEAQECDGSGFITHGDGHKTPCPGCKNCEKNETPTAITHSAEGDTVNPDVVITPDPVVTTEEENTKQILYFGASWCSYCVNWSNTEISKLKSKGLVVNDQDSADVRLIDVDRDNYMTERYKQTRSVPEFVKLTNGKVQGSRTGFMSANQIQRWLND